MSPAIALLERCGEVLFVSAGPFNETMTIRDCLKKFQFFHLSTFVRQ